jgi:hypothetical protein
VNKLFIYLIFIIPISSHAERYDPNNLVNNVVENNLDYTEKKTCDEEEARLQTMAKSCVSTICGPTKNIKTGYLSGEMFDNTNFVAAEMDFIKKKPDIMKAYELNRLEQMSKLEELISRIEKGDDLKFSNAEASQLLFKAILPNLNVTYDVDKETMSVTYDEIESKSKEKQKVIGHVIDWVKKNAKKDIEVRYNLNLPITRKEYIEYMERELPKLKELIDSSDNISTHFVDQIEYLAKNFLQNKENKASPNVFLRNNIVFLMNMKGNLKYDTGLGEEKDPMQFCKRTNCREVINTQFKNDMLPNLKGSLSYLKDSKESSSKIVDRCKSLFYQHEYNYQIRNQNDPREIMNNFTIAYGDFSYMVSTFYSRETAQIFDFKARMMTSLKLSGLPVQSGVVMKDGLDFLQDGTQRFLDPKREKLDPTKLSDSTLISTTLGANDLIGVVNNSCFGVDSGIKIADDSYNPFTKNLNISAFSCDHPKIGKHVIAHELGHVFSNLVKEQGASDPSMKSYLDRRKCVNSRILIPNYDKLKLKAIPEDHYHSEEDMADYLGNKTYKNLRELGSSENFGLCSLLHIQNGELGNLKFDYEGGNMHSPIFFRLLNSLTDKGLDLPSDCSSVLEKINHIYKPVSCK